MQPDAPAVRHRTLNLTRAESDNADLKDPLDRQMTKLQALHRAVYEYPAIDNHAHPLLKEGHRDAIPFESLISEAQGEPALTEDATNTLACFRATAELARALNLSKSRPSWDDVKLGRSLIDYEQLCDSFMDACNIQCLLLDDGLGGVAELAESWQWHRRFCETKRIVRIETEAEVNFTFFLLPISYKVALTCLPHFFLPESPMEHL